MPLAKVEMRRVLREKLRSLEGRWEKSRALCEQVRRHPAYERARVVALFAPLPEEPEVELLWEMAPKRFVYPRIEEEQVRLHAVEDRATLTARPGRRFREPEREAPRVEEAEVDFILVPGLGFTRNGRRLGRGGGFYDRLLARLPGHAFRAGICFSLQLCEELPLEAHDAPLDAVFTEIIPAPAE